MKGGRDKGVEVFSKDQSCKKHPKLSFVGICPFCLEERLLKLVCSDCGKQRLSSCSCSSLEVGRMSFLIENDVREEKSTQVSVLRRSSSTCVKANERNGFWVIRSLFKKKRDSKTGKDGEFFDAKSEIWVPSIVSRSRSVCSYRGFDDGSESEYAPFSSAKISDVTTNGIFLDSENEFTTMDDESEFFDLSLHDLKKEPSTWDRGFSFKTENGGFELGKKSDIRSNRILKWIFKYPKHNLDIGMMNFPVSRFVHLKRNW